MRDLRPSAGLLAVLAAMLPLDAASARLDAEPARCRVEASEMRAGRFVEGPIISPAGLRADLDAWIGWMSATHPDLSVRTDVAGFERMRAEISAAIDRPMTQRQAWLLFARLNPYLRDGHNSILLPDYRQRVRDHLAQGGRIVPFDAHIADDGTLRVRWVTGRRSGLSAGDRILAINGRDAEEIVDKMLAITEGDTPSFRRALAASRFAVLYWSLFGDSGAYSMVVEQDGHCPRRVLVPGAGEFPLSTPEAEYAHEILPGGIGYLRAGSFGGEHRGAFSGFARKAFAAFRQSGVRALIIDVRDNRGGDDPLWQESLMEHITDRPYIHVGGYATRITAENADPGEVVGSVQRQVYNRRITPSPDNPLRFTGPVYILKGPLTYSAAIQFVVAAQDFSIARIAGRADGALSCQTGRVRAFTLPNSGLQAVTPISAFVRPSNTGCDRPIVPHILIDDDGLDPRRAVELLADRIRSGT